GLGLDVPQGELDARDGLVGHPAEVLARPPDHVPVQALDRPRVLTDQEILEVAHAAGDAVRAPVVAALAPADETVVGLDAHERPRPPASVAVQRLHFRDLHTTPFRASACCSASE